MSIRHRHTSLPLLHLSLLACACASSLSAHAAETTPQAHVDGATVETLARRLQALEQRLGAVPASATINDVASAADLDQRLRAIEHRLALQDEAAATKPAATSTPASDADKGPSLKPPPAGSELGFKALVQADGRFFIGDDDIPHNDTFLWRRIRPTVEGNWGELVSFRLTPEFAGDSATIVDAYIDLKFDPRATLRIGKVKSPISLERLQSGGATALIERGFASELAPNRELGVQLQGAFAGSKVNYVLGIYNGAADGRDSPTSNPDNDFEFAARVFAEPWKNADNALSGLGFGIAGSSGEKHGSGNDFLPRYRTPGQATFFSYRSVVVADGRHARWSPQAYYYRRTFGVLGEYISSKQELRLPATGLRDALDQRAWLLTASYVLTGEDASYRGVTQPRHAFNARDAGWGAFEVVARYGRLDIDDNAFPLFADPATAASSATAWGLGLNWYLTGNLKLVANYTQTSFDGGTVGGHDRKNEKAFFTRAQFSF